MRLGTVSVDRLDVTEEDELQMSHYVAQTIVGEYTILLQAATVLLMSRRSQPGLLQAKSRRGCQDLCYAEAHAAAAGERLYVKII